MSTKTNGNYMITEQGDLGLGLNPIEESLDLNDERKVRREKEDTDKADKGKK